MTVPSHIPTASSPAPTSMEPTASIQIGSRSMGPPKIREFSCNHGRVMGHIRVMRPELLEASLHAA